MANPVGFLAIREAKFCQEKICLSFVSNEIPRKWIWSHETVSQLGRIKSLNLPFP